MCIRETETHEKETEEKSARGEKSRRIIQHAKKKRDVGSVGPSLARHVLTHLQSPTGVQNGIGDLRHGARDEEARRDDPDHRRERQDGLDDLGEELVQRHADRDGSEDDLLSFFIT